MCFYLAAEVPELEEHPAITALGGIPCDGDRLCLREDEGKRSQRKEEKKNETAAEHHRLFFSRQECQRIRNADKDWTVESFPIFYADPVPEMAALCFDVSEEFRVGELRLRFLAFGVVELRLVGAARTHFGFERIRDVDGEGRSKMMPLQKFKIVVRAKRLLLFSVEGCANIFQPRVEPRLFAECVGVNVVRVPVD